LEHFDISKNGMPELVQRQFTEALQDSYHQNDGRNDGQHELSWADHQLRRLSTDCLRRLSVMNIEI
jgi:3-methyladenine DNA glycosylase AlkC